MFKSTMQDVVVIGGGTGSFVVLSGLSRYSEQLNLSAIVTVADSGGSANSKKATKSNAA